MSQSDEKRQWNNGVVLSFDFNVADLRIYYDEKYPQTAYKVIKAFLERNGFEHLKDSDYKNPGIDDIDTTKLLYQFSEKNKWFPFCLKKMVISPNVVKLDISQDLWAIRDEDWARESLEREAKQSDKKSDDSTSD